jgi:hypothetical protein
MYNKKVMNNERLGQTIAKKDGTLDHGVSFRLETVLYDACPFVEDALKLAAADAEGGRGIARDVIVVFQNFEVY